MVTCSVSECAVNHRNNPDNYTFHRFPLDSIIRDKWLRLIGRVGWIPKKNSCICSKHFLDKYKRKSRMNTILLKGAIPTLFVPVQIKERVATSYVNRDITHPPLKSQDQEIGDQLTTREKYILSKNNKLKQKLQEKQKKIRSLAAKNKRQTKKIVTLINVLRKIEPSLEMEEQYSDIDMACSNE
ncbi:unnamed protein product [Parnassius mnemosyne]|uniref:THAP-type domain-containing protein n=1 Tax=Parnassius mnemosyne TaxID=213953 RepID=A0AAV1M917_9NEOP